MLTEHQVRLAALDRIRAMSGSCNAAHIDHNDGVLRGLIWALTGEDPGTYLTTDTFRVLQLLGIPARRVGHHVHWAYDVPDVEAGLAEPCRSCKEEGVMPSAAAPAQRA